MKTWLALFLQVGILNLVAAQDWHTYFPSKVGTEWDMTTSDEKGKESTMVTYKIVGRKGPELTLDFVILDKKKNKELSKGTTTYNFDGQTLKMSLKDFFPATGVQGNPDVEVKLSGDELAYPNTLTPGQSLPDANAKMESFMNGMRIMNMVMKITERKVGQNTSVTTPAGTFDCVEITQKSEVKALFQATSITKMWLAKGKGMIKSENYNEKGKLGSITTITRFIEK
jgi:hypothetical protein